MEEKKRMQILKERIDKLRNERIEAKRRTRQ